jgi:predicted metal-dependent hydrolase
MTHLVVRRLLVDMEAPIERHWCDGDPFRTAFLNALSMSFPIGEQFFIDSVRGGFKDLPAHQQERFKAEVQGFVGQEATHRRLHELYNAHLQKLGLVNAFEARARDRLRHVQGIDFRHWLAITAASEHFTAIFADWMLHNEDMLGDRDDRLKTLWLWHSAEESEHKCTAFDLYLALGGNHRWRMTWFRRVSFMFLLDVLRQTMNNLYHDGSLFEWRTWRNGASFLLGKRGLFRRTAGPWREYFRKDFHPRLQDSSASEAWLTQHRHRFRPVTP